MHPRNQKLHLECDILHWAVCAVIRPWQVDSGNMGRRCDPVTLYHHYQALWSKQKFPGEDDHADLRWTIRHRMLGQNPHPPPRVCAQY
ncbi:hypothetical protein PR048_001235 [Dryococelus australis]|uniref:Centriolar and ciliogenesis-associated protein HYLS1 C-terminal domain-containing protein n=1 Tax=Dryococelus australis TaxID=614101 RepID=A0ABQ9IGT7_9NEOP|nr:hypothetical protein PR048_001235 [Dryococelus australis]